MRSPELVGVVLGESNRVPEMLAGGCFAAGVILTAIGTWQRRTVLRLVANGKRATATAVDSVHRPSETGGEGTHHVVWRFRSSDGATHEHEGLASGVHHPQEGSKATIIYDPLEPYNARLENLAERTLAWALFFFAGLGLLAIAAVAALVAIR